MSKNLTSLIMSFCFLFVFTNYSFSDEKPTAVVILSKEMKVQEEIFTNFKNKLFSLCPDVKITKIIYNDSKKIETAKKINDISPSLVFTIGTRATKFAKEFIKAPKIFTLVVNPFAEGFCKNNGSPLEDMTGILISISPFEQFRLFKEANPNIKRIGVVYDPEKSIDIILLGKKAAKKLNLELIEVPVNNSSEVPSKFESLIGKVDAFWGIIDNTVFTRKSTEYVLLLSLRRKIPFFGFSIHQVKAGALMGIYCDYPELGKQASEIAKQIIDGKKPYEIPIQTPKIAKYAINKRASKILGIKISAKLQTGADKIISIKNINDMILFVGKKRENIYFPAASKLF